MFCLYFLRRWLFTSIPNKPNPGNALNPSRRATFKKISRVSFTKLGLMGLVSLVLWLSGLGGGMPAAIALIRQLEETPGQIVVQSRQSLRDQQGRSWQAIAFKRTRPDHGSVLYLRLVGFPGLVSIDRSQPLRFTNGLGNTLTAEDASAPVFTDSDHPEPQVGQYDLLPLIDTLDPYYPLQLSLPLRHQEAARLSISSWLIQEWLTVAHD